MEWYNVCMEKSVYMKHYPILFILKAMCVRLNFSNYYQCRCVNGFTNAKTSTEITDSWIIERRKTVKFSKLATTWFRKTCQVSLEGIFTRHSGNFAVEAFDKGSDGSDLRTEREMRGRMEAAIKARKGIEEGSRSAGR